MKTCTFLVHICYQEVGVFEQKWEWSSILDTPLLLSKMLRPLLVSALVYLSSGKYADLVLLQDAPEKYVRQGVLIRVPEHQISLGNQTQRPGCSV